MRVADYIAEFIYNQGVRNVFLLSGTGSIHLDDAFAFFKGIKFITARHEAAAAAMAEASAKLTNNLGVVVTTTGPGGTNAIGGVVEAWVDSIPVLVLSGQVTRSQIDPRLRSFGVQGFNIVDHVRGITKYAALVSAPKTIRFHLEKAIYLAKSGRPGPVWLDIPLDVQAETINSDTLERFVHPMSIVDDSWIKSVDTAVSLLLKAHRPLIVVGQGVRIAGAISDFKKLIERIGAPVIATRMGQDILPDTHPLYFNMGGIRGHGHTGLIMKQCDVILSLGSSMPHPFIGESSDAFADDVKIIMVDLDRAEIEKPGLRVTTPIVHDVREVIQYLLDKLNMTNLPNYEAWLTQCRRFKATYSVIRQKDRKNPINSYCFLEKLDDASGPHHIFVSDAGSSYYITGQILKFNKGQRDITSSAFASMGMTLPLAIGAAVTSRDAQILAITGDGSIELNIQELRTISQYKLNIKVFVINNGGYASIRASQDAICGGRYTDEQKVLNFKKVADAFELRFHILDRYESLDKNIVKILKEPGPALIEVVCDSKQEMIKPVKFE